MKRLNLDGRMFERDNGDYILFTDHEAAIKQAVAAEREAIVQYIINQGTITCGKEDIFYIDGCDIEAIRARGAKEGE